MSAPGGSNEVVLGPGRPDEHYYPELARAMLRKRCTEGFCQLSLLATPGAPTKSAHMRFVLSRCNLGLFLGGYVLDRRCDLA